MHPRPFAPSLLLCACVRACVRACMRARARARARVCVCLKIQLLQHQHRRKCATFSLSLSVSLFVSMSTPTSSKISSALPFLWNLELAEVGIFLVNTGTSQGSTGYSAALAVAVTLPRLSRPEFPRKGLIRCNKTANFPARV